MRNHGILMPCILGLSENAFPPPPPPDLHLRDEHYCAKYIT